MQYIILLAVTAVLAWANFDKPKVSKSFFLIYCLFIGLFVGLGDMIGMFTLKRLKRKRGVYTWEKDCLMLISSCFLKMSPYMDC